MGCLFVNKSYAMKRSLAVALVLSVCDRRVWYDLLTIGVVNASIGVRL